jgi:arginine:ornithine antiporter/lysine permease
LWLTNGVIQFFLLVTWFAESAFTLALKMTSAMTLLPYLLVAAYALKLAWTGETYAGEDSLRRRDRNRAAIATVYATLMLLAGGAKFLLLAALLYAPGSWLFYVARREQGAALFKRVEFAVFCTIVVAALGALAGLVTGALAI